MKSKYHATGNYLEELPQYAPLRELFDQNGLTEDGLRKGKDYLASLRSIPCHPSCVGKWSDGQEVEDGKDYEVKECRTWIQNHKNGWGCAECCNKEAGCDEDCDAAYYRPNCPFCKGTGWFKEQPLFAFPLPVKSEDDLWKEFLAIVASIHSRFGSNIVKFGFKKASEILLQESAELKQKYSLTKK